MTLTIEHDLDRVKLNQHAKYTGQFISLENYCSDIQTRTADRLLYLTTELIGGDI